MTLTRLFNPDTANIPKKDEYQRDASQAVGDQDGLFYYYHDEDIIHTVNIAMATNRPLLVRGPSGCGKSSLAYNIALTKGFRFYSFVVHSRATAHDLLWRFDAVRRLGDVYTQSQTQTPVNHEASPAQENGISESWRSKHPYLEPAALWWAFDPVSAAQRGWPDLPEDLYAQDPMADYNADLMGKPAVVLIDEIDKADPDFANDLLEPFGSYKFTVSETQTQVRLQRSEGIDPEKTWEWAPLLVITTNRERRLPKAFLRRCLVLDIKWPDVEEMARIACITLEGSKDADTSFYLELAKKLEGVGLWPCSIPEFVDLARTCRNLELKKSEITDALFSKIIREKE